MEIVNKKCKECGKIMKPSQYASLKREGRPAEKENENLVCINYPGCSVAEKEVS